MSKNRKLPTETTVTPLQFTVTNARYCNGNVTEIPPSHQVFEHHCNGVTPVTTPPLHKYLVGMGGSGHGW